VIKIVTAKEIEMNLLVGQLGLDSWDFIENSWLIHIV